MKRLQILLLCCLVGFTCFLTTGCGGVADNQVSEAPVTGPTPEELKAQQDAYAKEQAEMAERDRQTN